MESFLIKKGYDGRENYSALHLQWISEHKTFIPKEQPVFREGYTYLDMMKELYHIQMTHPCINKSAFVNYILDKAWRLKTFKIEQQLNKVAQELEPTPNGKWFVTIGFNHQTWNVKECCKVIEKILSMEWIISAKANFELHRENGEHPHVHFIIETKEAKSRILDKLFRPLYVKKVVISKNFIDIKPMMEYHLKYINLDKQSEKDIFVKKDKEWRIKENIPDYEKKWTTAIC